MKTHLSFLSVCLFTTARAASPAGPTIPQRPPPDAFQKLTEDWPFALATAATPIAEPAKPGWWSEYFVSGIKSGHGNEDNVVAIKKKDGTGSFSLFGNQPNEEGISVATIEWAEKALASRVTLKKGSEMGTIEFDQAQSQGASQPPPMMQRPGMPNVPGMKQPVMIRPPGAAVPRPANLPQPAPQALPIPGPSNTNAAPNLPANTNAVPNAPRQRVRVIPSAP